MRRLALLVSAVAVVLPLGLAAPPPASACAGCGPSWAELKASHLIALAWYRGRSGSRLVFDVVDVLKGPEARTLRLVPWNGLPGPSPWGRWLLLPEGDGITGGFRVSANGTVTSALTGEGQPADYPATLAAWYRALGLRPPDTSTAAAPLAPPSPAPGRPAPLLLAAALAGGWAMLRRLGGARPLARRRQRAGSRSASEAPPSP